MRLWSRLIVDKFAGLALLSCGHKQECSPDNTRKFLVCEQCEQLYAAKAVSQ